jgi:hypothetical protein
VSTIPATSSRFRQSGGCGGGGVGPGGSLCGGPARAGGDILYRFWWRVPIADAIATIMNMAITSHSKNNIAQLTSIVIVPLPCLVEATPRPVMGPLPVAYPPGDWPKRDGLVTGYYRSASGEMSQRFTDTPYGPIGCSPRSAQPLPSAG